MMMWSLRDPIRNSIGMMPILDPSDSYRKVLMLMSQVGDMSIDGMMKAIDDQAKSIESFIPRNIFRQLHNKLLAAPFHVKVQFRNAMNLNRNLFIVTNLDESDGKLVSFRADKRHAGGIVLDEWITMMENRLSSLSKDDRMAVMIESADMIDKASEIKIRSGEDGNEDRKAVIS